jgi:hypothetical protein
MVDEKYDEFIISFLSRNYPIVRIKHRNRFKRAIMLDDGAHLLSDSNSNLIIRRKLTEVLKIVFNYNPQLSDKLIKKALNI